MKVSAPRWALPAVTLLAALLTLGLSAFMLPNGLLSVAFSEATASQLKWGLFVLVGLALLVYAIASTALAIQMARSPSWSRRALFILQAVAVACVVILLFYGENVAALLGWPLIGVLILTITQFALARQET
jgi:hypothetical protein